MCFTGFRAWRPHRTMLRTWGYTDWPPPWCCSSPGPWRADAVPCCPRRCSPCTRCTRTLWRRWSAAPTCSRACSFCCRFYATTDMCGPETATGTTAITSSKYPVDDGCSRPAAKSVLDVQRPLTWCSAYCSRSCPCWPRRTAYQSWPCV